MRTIVVLLLHFYIGSIVFPDYYDASLDVNCVNDYDSEMACNMTAESSNDCSEYKLSVSLDTQQPQMSTCSFEHIYLSTCSCKLQGQIFVFTDIIKADLLKKGTVLFTKYINTTESIKPKRPIIKSVHLTENGNFLITWDTNYTQKSPFFESLSTELTYSVKGSSENETIKVWDKSQTKYEILGRKLLPYSKYIIRARVITDYNNKSSDYSEPYLFSTPSSLQDTLKIVIPIACVILIFFISTIYYCYIKIVQEWWEKIPVPNVSTFEKKVPHFPLFQNEFSTVCLDNSKLDHTDDKMWKSNSQEHCERSPSQVVYAQTGYENVEGIDAKCMLCKEEQAENLHMPVSDQIQKDLQPNSMYSVMLMEGGNSSGSSFNNRCYLGSAPVGSCLRDQPIRCSVHCQDDSEDLISAMCQNLEPLIPTDFEYGPCNGCSGSADTSLTHVPPSSSDFDVIFGYQSTSEVLDCGNKPDASVNQAFIRSHNDVNEFPEMAFCIRNPQDVLQPACESIIIPVSNGHPASQSSHRNPGEKWSADRSTELQQSIAQPAAGTSCHSKSWISQQAPAPSLEGLCHSVLHISPSIQIDYSYQKV